MHSALIAGVVAPLLFLFSHQAAPPGSTPPGGAAPPPQQEEEESPPEESRAMQILKAADEATRAVDSVKYEAHFRGVGSLTARAPVATGAITKLRASDDPELVKIHGEGWFFTVNQADRGQVEFIAAFDGQKVVRLDPQRKLFFDSSQGATDGQVLSAAQTLNMREFGHPTPFEDEINARTQTLEGRTLVGDVLCDVVYVEYDIEPAQSARWCFGVEDHLPRRVERLQVIDGHAGATVLTLTELEVNPEVDPAIFTLAIPEGYEQGRTGGPVPSSAPVNVGPNRGGQ